MENLPMEGKAEFYDYQLKQSMKYKNAYYSIAGRTHTPSFQKYSQQNLQLSHCYQRVSVNKRHKRFQLATHPHFVGCGPHITPRK